MSLRSAYQRQHKQRGVAKMKAKRRYLKNRNKYKLKAKQRYRRTRNNPALKRRRKLYRQNPNRFRRIQASGAVPFVFLGKDGREHEGLLVGALCEQEVAVYLVDGIHEAQTPLDLFFENAIFLEEGDIEEAIDCLDRDFGIGKVAFSSDTPTIPQLREMFEELPITFQQWRNTVTSFARAVHGKFDTESSVLSIPFAGQRVLRFRLFLRILPGEVSFDFIPLRGERTTQSPLMRMFHGASEEADQLLQKYARFLATLTRVINQCQKNPDTCRI